MSDRRLSAERIKELRDWLDFEIRLGHDRIHVDSGEFDNLLSFMERAALSPLTWRAMDSAPKDRTILVGYHNRSGNWRTVRGRYVHEGEMEDMDTGEFAEEGWYEEAEAYDTIYKTDCPPTHWMPLPAPPQIETPVGSEEAFSPDTLLAFKDSFGSSEGTQGGEPR